MAWDPWEILNIAASIGFTAALAPQVVRTLRRKRAQDISLPFVLVVLASSACMLPYMLHQGNWVFAGAQLANLLGWGVVAYYRMRPAPEAVPATQT